jgi:hypothetical protein
LSLIQVLLVKFKTDNPELTEPSVNYKGRTLNNAQKLGLIGCENWATWRDLLIKNEGILDITAKGIYIDIVQTEKTKKVPTVGIIAYVLDIVEKFPKERYNTKTK